MARILPSTRCRRAAPHRLTGAHLATHTLLALVGLLVAALAVGRALRSRWEASALAAWLPLFAFACTVALTTWMWGGLRAPPIWHDEAAYLLQAELLARGAFAAPSPPVPEAFTQFAVLVEPVLAPKMLPGHALLLVPGVWLGLPGLVPVLLVGLTAALMVALLARRVSPAVAWLAFVLWTIQAGQQRWRASYMSESTTAAGWLLGWWLLLRWREQRSWGPLVALGVVTGWLAITRPLAAVAFVVPVGVVVLRDAARLRAWGSVAVAVPVGLSVFALVALQNRAVLGDWRAVPLQEYTAQYLPYDRMGFGLDTTPPSRPLPAALDRANEPLRQLHEGHRPERMVNIAVVRVRAVGHAMVHGWRVVLLPILLIGMATLPPLLRVPVLSALVHVALYLLYAHEPSWTAYYVEVMTILAAVTAVGCHAILSRIHALRGGTLPAALALSMAVVPPAIHDMMWSRRIRAASAAPFLAFAARAAALVPGKVLVLVRPDTLDDPHRSVVRNVSSLRNAAVITAYDLDPNRSARVVQAFPAHLAYRYDPATQRFTQWSRHD